MIGKQENVPDGCLQPSAAWLLDCPSTCTCPVSSGPGRGGTGAGRTGCLLAAAAGRLPWYARQSMSEWIVGNQSGIIDLEQYPATRRARMHPV